MEIVILPDPEQVQKLAAKIVKAQVTQEPNLVLGCATGSTMEGFYAELLRHGAILDGVTTFNLDEYLGLDAYHPCSYAAFMQEHFFRHTAIPPQRRHLLDGKTDDVSRHCAAYEEQIRAVGGIDLQLLGIGRDGHIAFNEPGSSLASRTRLKILTPLTRESNARHFPPGWEVPKYVLTMGIGTILEAHRCLLLAFGESKAEAIAAAVEGPLSADCPASALQFHQRTTVIIDGAAAQKLRRAEYYRTVYENKPNWMRRELEGE